MKKIFLNKLARVFIYVLLIIFTILITGYQICESSLKLIGKQQVEINYNQEYIDEGVNFKLFSFNLNDQVEVKENINEKQLGDYKVVYLFKDIPLPIKKVRVVKVVDRIPPSITLKGDTEFKICPNRDYQENGYQALDEYDGDLTNQVEKIVKEDKIIYKVKDSSNNQAVVERKLIRIDDEAPKITLKGSKTVYINVGSSYSDLGYEIVDNCDNDIKVEIENNINTNQVGKYIVTYKAIDKAGNGTSISRNVVVYDGSKGGIIYLTFDDGPSNTGSTAKILDVLKKEGVKATFFVTTKGSDDLIRREHNEGHKVALHTSSHDYGYVYQSVDNYFNDLYAVRDRVYRLTGEYANIIRFPGGSNNTVSNRYNYGIMDVLVKEVVNRGFYYFDWNVSSGDAGSCYDSNCVYQNVINQLSKSKNNIVLMHDIKMFTADAIERIIQFGKMQGYSFQVIDESTRPVHFK